MSLRTYRERDRGVFTSPRRRAQRAVGLIVVGGGILFPPLMLGYFVYLALDRTE